MTISTLTLRFITSFAVSFFPLPMLSIRPHNRKFWRLFLNDLSYLIPAFAGLLGILLLLGSAPHWGASLLTLGSFALLLRINSAFSVRRERQFLAYFERWTRTYFDDERRPSSFKVSRARD